MSREKDRYSPDTPDRTSPAVSVSGTFLIAILAFGIVATAMNPAIGESHGEAEIITGEWAARYQRSYADGLLIQQPATHLWTLFQYRVFGEGQPGLLVGTDGWLFTDEEFTYYESADERIARRLDFIVEVRDGLAERGAALVVALVPAKARVVSGRLGRYRYPDYARPRYDSFRRRLLERDVPAPDLARALEAKGEEAFLRTDTHWTPAGALAAAAALADEIDRTLESASATRRSFVREERETVRHEGELLTFLPLGPFMERFGPEPDTVGRFATSPRERREAGLFEEVSIPITLVGTSYSAGELWDFAGALQATASADVLNVSTEGEGPFVPMREYLDGETLEESPPAVVVWEIPERYLPAP
ncbi:MAG: alginate O-acetyltransferase AlgX-related protein [Spirochaetota bacterium]